ncbi:MAG TPA: NAD(+) synthase, partial [Cyanobacteria bacterium UBA9273]|nr:NAD(+) synthase [Cyanobacteria bacterium UBA9273]
MNNPVPEISTQFDKHSLELDVTKETERIVEGLRQSVHQTLRRQGAVLGISGGIDSSVVLGLCVKAFGPERVVALLLPEGESSPDSATLAQLVADHYGVKTIAEDISGVLDGFGCYQRRNEAIAHLFPEFGPGWSAKIALPGSLLEKETLNIFSLTVTNPDGEEFTKRLPPREYYQIVAASNFKQRSRMAMLYYHAELRNYAVIGTPNKNEHMLGFFVKHGDGGIDVSPIGH